MQQAIQSNIFYNYIYCDPRKMGVVKVNNIDLILPAEPFYVGKGKGVRKTGHLYDSLLKKEDHKNHKIRKILSIGLSPIIIQLNSELPEAMAHQNEIFLIKAIGRADLGRGPLTNLTSGGEGVAGCILGPSLKRKEIVVYDPKTKNTSFYKSIDAYLGKGNESKGSKISKCCLGISPQYKGLIIFYRENYTKDFIENRIARFEEWKIHYAKRYKRRIEKHPIKAIVAYDPLTKEIQKFSCAKEYLGVNYDKNKIHLRSCCRGERKHLNGKIFFYDQDFNDSLLQEKVLSLLKDNKIHKKTRKLIGLL